MLAIATNEVHLYRLDLDDSSSEVVILKDQLLSEAEKEKANNYVQDIHRVRYQRGRSWVRKILAEYVGVSGSELHIQEQECGKPFLENHAIEFNLSHSENLAVLAVTQDLQVGIDIEHFSRLVELDKLSKIHFLEPELKWLAGFSGDQKQQAFFWLWTAKEARMKITGEGFALPSTEIEVLCEAGLPVAYQLPTEITVELTTLSDVFTDSACCLATLAPVQQLVQK